PGPRRRGLSAGGPAAPAQFPRAGTGTGHRGTYQQQSAGLLGGGDGSAARRGPRVRQLGELAECGSAQPVGLAEGEPAAGPVPGRPGDQGRGAQGHGGGEQYPRPPGAAQCHVLNGTGGTMAATVAGAARQFADLAKNLREIGEEGLRRELFKAINDSASQ